MVFKVWTRVFSLLIYFVQDVLCEDIKLGVILPYENTYPWSIQKVLPAIEYAIEKIESDTTLLQGHRVIVNKKDSKCSETIGPIAAIDMYVKQSANIFVGPACDYAVAPVARFSPFWDIPVITAGALVGAFKDKKQYRLLTRITGSFAEAGEFFVTLCNVFHFNTVGLLYHDSKGGPTMRKSDCFRTMEAIYKAFKQRFNSDPWFKNFDETSNYDPGELLNEASKNIRIVALCASSDSVRDIMLKAREMKFDNGEYVFFNIDLFNSKNENEMPWYREDDSPEKNEEARKAYEALMTVTLQKPMSPEYRKFSEEMKRRAKLKYNNFTYGEGEVNSFVGAFHDAVILYALALNEALMANISISNGTEITKRMWNRTFQGITGLVSIDDNGDRNADYSLLDLNPKTKKFEVVASYYGNKQKYAPVPNKVIHWAGGRISPPPDTPVCGFDNSKCPTESKKPFPTYGIVIIVLGVLLIVVMIVAFILYRSSNLCKT